jgi:hypothetical protein
MKIGDRVEVVAVPGSLPSGMGTQALFEACVGRVFPIAGIDNGLLELHVGQAVGEENYCTPFGLKPAALFCVPNANDNKERTNMTYAPKLVLCASEIALS